MSNKPPLISHRRIDHLKARAFDSGFTNEDAKQFGKLSKTATWEALLETYGIPLQVVDTVDSVDSKAQSLDTSDWTNDGSFPVCNFTPPELNQFFRLG
jgi:crotonobetainyl-CoA:carnitine CoA-transferase CaiB-like acyl-CoA transferase